MSPCADVAPVRFGTVTVRVGVEGTYDIFYIFIYKHHYIRLTIPHVLQFMI